MKRNSEFKVLVVDDDPDQLKVTERLLKNAQYSVRIAGTGMDCLEAIQIEKPDMLLLDVVLPDMSGIDICTILKNDARLSSIYIIMLSGLQIRSEQASEGLETGADGYLVKPVRNRELLARVEAAFRTIQAEKNLRLVQTRTDIILSEIPDIIMEVDRNKCYTWANVAGFQFFGDDVIGKEADYYFEGEQDTYSIVKPLFKGNEDVFYVESWQRRKDGEKRLLAWWCKALKDENGKVTGALSSAKDITEMKQVEKALNESESRFRSLVKLAPIPFAFVDQTNVVSYLNDRFIQVFGYTSGEIHTTEDWFKLAYPDETYRKLVKETWSQVVSLAMQDHTDIRPMEYNVTCRNGMVRVMEISGITIGENLLVSFLDLTERNQAETHLRKLNRTYALLSEINHAIIHLHKPRELFEKACSIAVGHGGFIMAWIGLLDPQSNQIIPVASSGIIGNYLDSLNIRADQSERGKGPTATALQTGKHIVINDITLDSRMSPWRDEAIKLGYRASAAFPLRVEGVFRGTINLYSGETGFFNDEELKLLDELAANIAFAMEFAEEEDHRKRAESELMIAKEKAEQSDKLKSAFLANMSHEIRTPMNAIVGFASLLSDPSLSAEERNSFSAIIQSRSEDLMHIISDILDISRIESGSATAVKQSVSLNAILDEMLAIFAQKLERIKKTNLSLKAEKINADEIFSIITDGYILRQVFSNLIDNAIKYSESGLVRFGFNLPVNNTITFFVADSGIGISTDDQQIIFEHFRQAETQFSHKSGGTGLGLSICKGSLALIGGEIWVDSSPGQGSTFFFSIPYEPGTSINKPARSEVNKSGAEKNYNWTGKKILLVEDEPANMNFLQIILGRTNADLIPAFNGKQLKEMYGKLDTFDLILLDIRLPDANGWELAKEIRSLQPDLPVIAQTAFAMSTDQLKSRESGCSDYLSKPLRKNTLLSTISKFI